MNDKLRAHPVGTTSLAVLIVGALLVAVLAVLFPSQSQRRLLRFPDVAGAALHAEWRELPYRASHEEQLELFVEELILGPIQLGAVPVIPRDTTVRGVVISDDGTAYIDLSREFMFSGTDTIGTIGDRMDLIARNIKHNFRYIGSIIITIEGQLPNEPRFAAVGR